MRDPPVEAGRVFRRKVETRWGVLLFGYLDLFGPPFLTDPCRTSSASILVLGDHEQAFRANGIE
jgi:hypothetical protein